MQKDLYGKMPLNPKPYGKIQAIRHLSQRDLQLCSKSSSFGDDVLRFDRCPKGFSTQISGS